MYLLELAAQGLQGCSPSTRAALSPGYVLLKPPGAEPAPLAAVTTALLHADGRGGDAQFLAPGAKSGKVALTLQGNDLVTYRLVRELGGAGALHRLNKAAQRFELVSQDAQEIGQFLRGQAGLPGRTTFEQLFTLSLAQLPSRSAKQPRAGGAPAKETPRLATAAPVTAASDVSAAQARLRELEDELERSKQIDELQFRQDGIASELFELESKLKGTDGLTAALAEAKAAYQSAPTAESLGLGKDLLERAQRYPQAVQRRDEQLAKVAQEREAEAERVRPTYVEPLHRDLRFVVGAAVGLLCLLGGLLLRSGSGRYLALLDVPAFGFAALVALKWVDDLQGASRVGRKDGLLAAREKKIEEDFRAEVAPVKQALAALGVESTEELAGVLGRKALYAEKVKELEAQLAATRADPELARAAQRQAALRRESEELSQRLQELSGGYVRDAREVERELSRVRESIELARSGAPVVAPSPSAPAGRAEGGSYEDPTPSLLSLAGDLLQLDPTGVTALVKDRCAQYVAALCDRRYTGLEIDHHGQAKLVSAQGPVPATGLPAKDLDLYYLSLRLTLVEKLSASAKVPLILDDVLPLAVDEAKLPLVGRMLKHLGTLTQVLHASAHPAQASMADAQVSL